MDIRLPAPTPQVAGIAPQVSSLQPALPPERYTVREELVDHSNEPDPGVNLATMIVCTDEDASQHMPGEEGEESTRQMPIFCMRSEDPGVEKVRRFAEHWKRLLNGEPLTRQEVMVIPRLECFEK